MIKITIICFHSYRGGSGKTTIAINLAYHLARKKNRVLLIDADFQAPSIQDYLKGNLNIENNHTLTEYLTNVGFDIFETLQQWKENEKVKFDVILTALPGKFELRNLGRVLSAPPGGIQLQITNLRKMFKIFIVKNRYDFILVDTTPGLQVQSLWILIGISDLVLEIIRDIAIDYCEVLEPMKGILENNLIERMEFEGIGKGYKWIINETFSGKNKINFQEEYPLDEEKIVSKLSFSKELRQSISPCLFSSKKPNTRFFNEMENLTEKLIEIKERGD